MSKFNPERFGLVTGSRCTPLVPIKSAEVGQKTLARELASEMFFKFYDEVSTWQTDHGVFAEEHAFDYYKTKHDPEVKQGRWVSNGMCGGSIDAEGFDYVLDFKCPTSLNNWLDYIHKGISKDQENQMQMYMYLTGHNKAIIAAYLIETQRMADNGILYPVTADKRMLLITVEKDPNWIIKLKENLPNVIKWRNEYLEVLQNKFKA